MYWLGYLFPVCSVNPHASQMDEYKHACTDCSFKCTNKHDLKVTTFASKELQKQDKLNPLICVQIHYSEMHSKQRQRFFACPMCDHKSNDVNNMKRHINTVHHSDARRGTLDSFCNHLCNCSLSSSSCFRCDQCEFQSEQKTLLLQHRYSAHEGLTISAGVRCNFFLLWN